MDRIWDGWPISYALERGVNDDPFYDHCGNSFKRYTSMCKYYEIDKFEFADRINNG